MTKLTDDQKEELRAAYPKRQGNNWVQVRKLLDRHLSKGVNYSDILFGTQMYAKYIEIGVLHVLDRPSRITSARRKL